MEMSQIDQTAYLELQCFLPSFLFKQFGRERACGLSLLRASSAPADAYKPAGEGGNAGWNRRTTGEHDLLCLEHKLIVCLVTIAGLQAIRVGRLIERALEVGQF
jgi:hypothetical protein